MVDFYNIMHAKIALINAYLVLLLIIALRVFWDIIFITGFVLNNLQIAYSHIAYFA